MIKINVGEILNINQVLGKVLTKELPVKVAFKLSKLIKNIDNEIKTFEEQRIKMVEKFGTKNEDGTISVKKPDIPEFQKELNSLLEIEVELNVDQVSINDLGDKIEISPVDLAILEKIITE